MNLSSKINRWLFAGLLFLSCGNLSAATSSVERFVTSGGGGGGSLDNVVEDTSPQLGGDLDLNTHVITGMVIGTDIEAKVTEGSLADSTILSADIKDGEIVNADISASAAIAFSKLGALASGNILVGSAGGAATSVNPSGDIDVNSTGVFSIASGVIVNADTANDALDPDKLVGDSVDDDKIDAAILSEATTPSAEDNDTSIATTAFVRTEELNRVRKLCSLALIEPDQIQTVQDVVTCRDIDAGEFPNGVTITEISLTTDASSSCSYNVEEWTDTVTATGATATIDAIATSSTSETRETTISDASVAAGNFIRVDLDTCDVNEATVTVFGYATAP